jgi:hypothetical protein
VHAIALLTGHPDGVDKTPYMITLSCDDIVNKQYRLTPDYLGSLQKPTPRCRRVLYSTGRYPIFKWNDQ